MAIKPPPWTFALRASDDPEIDEFGRPMLDRRPPAGRSPFEAIGQGGKMQRPQEQRKETCPQAPDTVQGCGDPSCQICMPASGGGSGGKTGGSSSSTYASSLMMAAISDRMLRDLTGGITSADLYYPMPSSSRRGEAFTFSDPPSAESKADAKLKELRGPIEKYLLKTEHAVAWDDVVGNQAAREALIEAVEAPTKHAAMFAHYGARATRGALLYGPPGCGKTMFAKAASSILRTLHGGKGHEMLVINGPQIQSPYVGVTEEIIRAIFAYARAYKARWERPLVIFVDECDAILPSRDGTATGRRALSWEESNVATFLTEMDGMEESGAFVLLATNRPDAIDPALLRDGRCDRRIRVERPGMNEAEVIIGRALKNVPVADKNRELLAWDMAVRFFAPEHAIGFIRHSRGMHPVTLGDTASGAMVVGLVERSKGIAMRRDLAAGGPPTGVMVVDAAQAVDELVREARGMPVPLLVAQELAERHELKVEGLEPYRAPSAAFSPEEIEAVMAEESAAGRLAA